jgi:hypothetical protein
MTAEVTALARKFAVQVTADTTLTSGWIPLNGITDLDPEIKANLEDSTAYDTDGWSTSEPTLMSWTLAATFFRRMTANVYDPGQELVRACQGQFGAAARIGVQWYDRNGGPEAYSGVAVVDWKRSNTAVKDLEEAVATFTGTDVPLNMNIANPYQTELSPVITGVTPSGVGAGVPVAITGTALTGTTAVDFGGVAATHFEFINDQLVVATLPTGSAGAANVTVTTPIGTSTAFAYTRTE